MTSEGIVVEYMFFSLISGGMGQHIPSGGEIKSPDGCVVTPLVRVTIVSLLGVFCLSYADVLAT